MTVYKPNKTPAGNIDSWTEAFDANWAQLERIDDEARKKGTILHRYITHPYADGRAVYQIVKVNKKTVRIVVCGGFGDDWILPAWGRECLIERKLAESFIQRHDHIPFLCLDEMKRIEKIFYNKEKE